MPGLNSGALSHDARDKRVLPSRAGFRMQCHLSKVPPTGERCVVREGQTRQEEKTVHHRGRRVHGGEEKTGSERKPNPDREEGAMRGKRRRFTTERTENTEGREEGRSHAEAQRRGEEGKMGSEKKAEPRP